MEAKARQTHPLEPYVPRVLSEWDLDSPDSKWQRLDGTLCFVDISGFTNLSEKLARRGRIGAEELTDVLDRVFGNMLRLAYARGGSLLKFGGDALLLLFEGGDHAMQGTCAAVEMRAALREAARIPTSVGKIRLRMSVGVHTGPIDLFRVGESHHELIITGDTATTTTEMEATADAGEIVISPELRAVLPADAAQVAKGNGWVLRWTRPRVETPGPVLRRKMAARAFDRSVPTQLRDYLSTTHAEPEHRIATVGFVKFKGIGAEWSRGGPAAVAEGLDRLITAIQETADAEGVTFLATDIDEDGGKVILTTGVPSTREDDEGRMLRTLRQIADSEQTFPVKIGANRGHVFAGGIGTEFRSTYTVMGDTVNLAARLMAAAPPGEVYTAPGVLDRSRTLFDTIALKPFRVKGKSAPVQAYSLGEELGVRPGHQHGVLSFVGRSPEIAALRQGLEGIDAGRGAVVTVLGEAGIGKSRLVEEALAGSELAALSLRAEPNSTGNPYWTFRDPIRRLLGVERNAQDMMAADLERAVTGLGSDLADDVPLLGAVAHIEVPDTPATAAIEPRFRPARTADALVRLLDRLFAAGGVIVAEDGHWMDEASLGLMRRLAAAAATRPWMVVVTARALEDTVGEVIELGPLSEDESRQAVIAATEAAPLRPSELDLVVTRAGGNPLFLGEIVRVVRETGGVEDLPESLDAVVGAEIDALPALARRLLRMSSVLGRSFRRVVLDAFLAEEDVVLDAATTRALARFIDADDADRYRFRHAAVHQVAYEGLPYRRRRELHARAGAAIEKLAGDDPDAVAEFLALHYSEARDYPKAWRYAVTAGDRAKGRYAINEAAAQYRVATDAGRHLPDIDRAEAARIHEALGDVCELAGMYDEADRTYASARKLLADDPQAQGRLMAKQGLIREKAGRLPVALSWFRRGLHAAEGTQGDAQAELSIAYAGIRFRQGKFPKTITWCERALADPGATDAQRGHALHLLVLVYAELGMPEAEEVAPGAIEIYERIGDLAGLGDVLNNLGVNAFYRGNWDESDDYHARAETARRRAGHVIGAAASINNRAEIYCDQGKLEHAESMFRESLYVFESSSFPVGVALASANLGRTLTRAGRSEEAWEYLERGMRLFSDMGASAFIHETEVKLAEFFLLTGRRDAARSEAEKSLGTMPKDQSTLRPRSGLHRVLAYCAVADLAYDEALLQFETSLEAAQQARALYEQAATYEGMARTLRHDERAPEWDRLQAEMYRRLGVVATPVIPLA